MSTHSAPLPALVAAAAVLAFATPAWCSEHGQQLRDLLQAHCCECHGTEVAEQDLDYESMTDLALLNDHEVLDLTLFMVEEQEMPPPHSDHSFDVDDRTRMIAALVRSLADLSDAAPNDPGIVVAPRLNQSEYDYVVEDLTGLDLDLGQFLVPDNQAGEGFVNVGAAQNMTVGQFEAYLDTAKLVVRHAVITPESGIDWQPRPLPDDVVTAQHLRDYLRERWLEWHQERWKEVYDQHQRALERELDMHLGAYFEGTWRYRYRSELGMPEADFAAIAQTYDTPLFASALERLWGILHGEEYAESRFIAQLRERWHALPAPDGGDPTAVRAACRELERWQEEVGDGGDDYSGLVRAYEVFDRSDRQQIRGQIHHGTWPYRIDLTATEGQRLYLVVTDAGDGNEGDIGIWEKGVVHFAGGRQQPLPEVVAAVRDRDGNAHRWGSHPDGAELADDALAVQAPSVLVLDLPADAEQLTIDLRLDERYRDHASVQTIILDHPPATTGHIPGRGIPGARRGGFERAKVLVEAVHRLARLDLHSHKWPDEDWAFVAFPEDYARYYDIPWPQRLGDWSHGYWDPTIFGAQTPEIYARLDAEALAWVERRTEQMVGAAEPALSDLATFLAEHDLARDGQLLPDEAQLAGLSPEQRTRADDLLTAAHGALSQQALRARELLATFTAAAWARPVGEGILDELLAFYRHERATGASFDRSVKIAMTAALMHPHFLYRFTRRNDSEDIRPLTGHELATRLAFSIWGRRPDQRLLELGDSLQDDEVLATEVARMLADERAVALASEFAGHWLQFHDFSSASTPDSERFEGFEQVRADMVLEARLFFADLFRENRPVTRVIDADYAFLNQRLAEWYGVDGVSHRDFRRIDLPAGSPRGGVLGMGAVLVKYSEPLRTSPVRRGAWVYEHLLGHHLPQPPADVPMISDDERNEEGQTIREQLEEHRSNPACFSCHDKIDPPGIALERFDAVGRWRDSDLAGDPIDDQGRFIATDVTLAGVAGLRQHLLAHRDQFVRNFCIELLGYCLGREVEPTDADLLAAMQATMAADDFRPRGALTAIFTSQQFRYRRDSGL